MQRTLVFLVLLFMASCKKQREYTLDDFQSLNGYWQITKVFYPDGTSKKYNLGPSIDYIEIKGDKGVKKKVYPKLDGTYETSNDAVTFRIINKAGNGYFVSYNDSINGWQEKMSYMAQDFFSVRNQDLIIYCYNRYQPLDLGKE